MVLQPLWSYSHICTWLLENDSSDYTHPCQKSDVSALSRFMKTILSRTKCLSILWLQSLNTVVFKPNKIKSVTVFTFSHIFAIKWWDQTLWSKFSECWVLSQLFYSPLSFFITRFFNFSSLSVIRVISSASLWLLIFLLAILIPDYDPSSPAFCMMYSEYKLNKQGDNI